VSRDNATRGSSALDREGFDHLLRRLDPDPEQAAALYNRHRQRLVHYFAWQHSADAETLADEVIDRVARKLRDGEDIPKIGAYFLGVARLVGLEHRARMDRTGAKLREYSRRPGPQSSPESPGTAATLECLERCLAELDAERRELILAYYTGEASGRIPLRRQLAERFGLQANALRNRALRLRQALERCVADCRQRRRPRDQSGEPITEDRGAEDRDQGNR
jgi:DNA-directed RNA polymerase specialized sigma24 family protein